MLKSKLEQLCMQIREQAAQPGNIALFSTKEGCPELFETLSALANSPGGGTILFGLEVSGEGNGPRLRGVCDVADLKEKINWQCGEMAPALTPLYTETCVEGRCVLAAEIPEVDKKWKPCYHRAAGCSHSAFKRVEGSNRLMTEAEIHSYEAYEKRMRDELRPCEQAQWLDIDPTAVQNYMRRLVATNRLNVDMDEEQLLRMEGLRVDGKPTLAAMLLFGYDPQSFYPQFSIMAAVYSQGKVKECRRINGTLEMLCDQGIQFVRRNTAAYRLPEGEGGRQARTAEFPIDAIREALLNALIHRDYSRYAEDRPVYLWVYENCVQVCSPGGFFGAPDTQYPIPGLRNLRNPKIMEVLETMGALPQERSGLQYMADAMRGACLEPPEIKAVDDWLTVSFCGPTQENWKRVGRPGEEMSELERQVWDYCSEPRTLAELAVRFGWKSPYYMRGKILTEMIDKELLEIVDLYAKQKIQYLAVTQ